MEEDKRSVQHIAKHVLKFDKLCFTSCMKNYERSPNVKEEACLKNCLTKVINAIDFLDSVNKRGGFDRAPFKTEQGFWSQ